MHEDDDCIHGLAPGTCSLCSKGATSSARKGRLTRSGRPMDILLKWSPAHEDDTCDQHRATAAAMGSTWWGCWSSGETRGIAADRLDLVQRQLVDGVHTRAFVYRLGPDPELWQATVLSIAEDDSAIDGSHRPPDMSFEGCFLFVELADFTLLEPDWAEQHLALWDKPTDGLVPHGALHNQTTPMYVFELPGTGV